MWSGRETDSQRWGFAGIGVSNMVKEEKVNVVSDIKEPEDIVRVTKRFEMNVRRVSATILCVEKERTFREVTTKVGVRQYGRLRGV